MTLKAVGQVKCPGAKCGHQLVFAAVDGNPNAPFISNHQAQDGTPCEAGGSALRQDEIEPVTEYLLELATDALRSQL